jgi:hypothetical protein
MLFLTPILIIVFVPLSLWIAIVEPSRAWMWLLVAALLVLMSGPSWFFLLRLMPKRGIVIAENGLWHDSGLIRLRIVFWSEVGQLERHGKTLRIKLADREAFNAARPGVHLLGDAPYAPLALNAYALPPDEVVRLIERQLEAWRARQAWPRRIWSPDIRSRRGVGSGDSRIPRSSTRARVAVAVWAAEPVELH